MFLLKLLFLQLIRRFKVHIAFVSRNSELVYFVKYTVPCQSRHVSDGSISSSFYDATIACFYRTTSLREMKLSWNTLSRLVPAPKKLINVSFLKIILLSSCQKTLLPSCR